MQVDYNNPVRFDLEYTGADGQKHRPVMIHRAPFGSMERFTGVLIEHFAGAFPVWLSPEQVRVLTISEKADEFAQSVYKTLNDAGVRVTLDTTSDKIGAKIRNAQLEKIPYMLVVGQKEAEDGVVAVRHQKRGDLGVKALADFLAQVQEEIKTRAL